jgi:hypothetical protein
MIRIRQERAEPWRFQSTPLKKQKALDQGKGTFMALLKWEK